MPVVVNNNFSQDTYGMRTERLIAIQENFDSVQPDLQAPAHIVAWAEDCYDVYSNLLAVSGLEMSESETATAVVAESVAALESAYQNVRYIGTSIYADNMKIQNEYSFNEEFPASRDDMFRRVDKVALAYDKHTDEGLTPLIPANLISRLATAASDLREALGNQDKERFEARRAVTDVSERFVADSKILNELKSWTYVMFGKNDDRLTLIGIVNPQSGGGGGTPTPTLVAPSYISYNSDTYYFTWGAVPNAESYEFQYREESSPTWLSLNAGIATNFLHADPPGDYIARVRAISGTTMGEWSSELSYSPGSGGN